MRLAVLVSAGLVVACSGAAFAAAPDDICKNPVLTPQERSLCKDQIAGANTKTERQAVQAKFRDRIKAREEAGKK